MANPMNESLSILLGAIKNGGKNGLNGNGNGNGLKKIRDYKQLPEYKAKVNQINAEDWRHTDDDHLILDTPEKEQLYKEWTFLSGSTARNKNVFLGDIEVLERTPKPGKVVKGGTRRRVKANKGFSKITSPTEIKFNDADSWAESIRKGVESRDYKLMPGGANEKAVVAALKKFDIYDADIFTEFQQWNIRSVEDTLAGLPVGMTAGHAKSASKGGPMTGRNLWAESASENYSRQAKSDAPDELLDAIGAYRTWEITVGKWLWQTGKKRIAGFEPTEAEKLFTNEDMIESLATMEWKSVLQRRKLTNLKLQQRIT